LLFAATSSASGTLLYATDRQVHSINDDGSDDHVLTTETCAAGQAKWSPDGSRIVYMRHSVVPVGGPACFTVGSSNNELMTMSAGGGVPDQLTSNAAKFFDNQPAWSPDGTKIVFTSDRDGTPGRTAAFPTNIWGVNADGTGLQRLTHIVHNSSDVDPHYTPDGRSIIYSHGEGGGPAETWIMGADGSHPTPLIAGVLSSYSAVFSPDGTQLAFVDDSALYTLQIDSGAVTQWLPSSARVSDPVWAPDQSAIAYSGEVFAPESIINVSIKPLTPGAAPVQLTHLTQVLTAATVSDWRPSSRFAYTPPVDVRPPVWTVLGSNSIATSNGPLNLKSASVATRARAATLRNKTLRSRAKDLKVAVADRTGIRSLKLSLARKSGTGCRFETRSGFGANRSCSVPAYVNVSLKGGLQKLTAHLAKGVYIIRFRTVDVKGNVSGKAKPLTVRITG
jgi:dipeptidyl aminopeptidase/acylaminoacyl peptidase